HVEVASAVGELLASLDLREPPATRVVSAPSVQPSPPPVSALRSLFSQSDEATTRDRARQLTIKASRLWQVNAAARVIVSPLDPAEINLMVKSGLEFMAIGNIGAARLMFQPAAEAGDTVAAFALAETYDPAVLKKLGTKGGITPDIRLANSWYEKAGALGSTLARERLERLARGP